MPDTGTPLRALIVEDSEDDAALLVRDLRKSGYAPAPERVESAEAMRAALKDKSWDIIFSDYVIPGFGGMEALQIARESGSDLPFIVISGKVGEEKLVEVMKAGASDFLVKGHLGRLGSVVKRELLDAAARRGVRQAQIEWRMAFDAIRDPVFFHDAEYRILRANLAYAALARVPVRELIGMRYWEAFPKQDGPLPHCKDITEGHQDWGEEEFTLQSGETYSSRSFPITDQHGKYLYSFHVLQDITERNRVRDAVEASERRFRSLTENATDLVWIIDGAGQIRYVSPSIQRSGGYAPDEVCGHSIMDFTHPDDMPAAHAALHAVTSNPHDTYTAEIRLRSKDGSFVVLDSIARNALDDPAIAGIIINARDISDRKRAQAALEQRERYFRKLIEGGADAFFVIDKAGAVIYRSPSGKQLTGYGDDEVMGTSVTNYVVPEDLPLVQNTIAETIRNPGKASHVELRLLHKDGTQINVEAMGRNLLADPDVGGIVVTMRDISERMQSQERLARSERHFRKLIEGSADAFFVIDKAGTIIYRSPSGKQLTGYDDDEVMGKNITNYVIAGDLPLARSAIAETIRKPGKTTFAELRLLRKDGTQIIIEAVGKNLLADPDVGGIVVTARNITERKLAEIAIQKERDKAQSYLDIAGVMFLALDLDARVTLINKRGCEILGYTAEEVLNKRWMDVFLPERDRNSLEAAFGRLVTDMDTEYYENVVLCKDGREKMIAWHNTVLRDEAGTIVGTLHSGEDITERKRAEEAVRASRDLLGSIVENAPIRVFWKDAELRYLGCNSLFARDAGMSRVEDVIGKDDFQMGWREQAERYRADDRRVIDTDTPKLGIEEPQTTPDGGMSWLRTSKVPLHDTNGKVFGVLGIYDDITERKRAESELVQLNWALRALSRSNSSLVHAASEEDLFTTCCEAIASSESYPLAWIGLARKDAERSVECVAAAGKAIGYMEGLKVTWSETALGRGPTGTAIRTGTTQVTLDVAASTAYEPWQEKARTHGFRSSVSLPVSTEGAVIGALTIYSRNPSAFGAAEVALFEELAGDIGYGIAARRTRLAYEASLMEREATSRKLSATFESAIQALAATVEQRDPYTAGHQRRVALLATAIGRELGLDEDRLAGLRIAATIHDIGKIYVPAEILARTGKLGTAEFEIIKAHAQVGYDIIKGVDFPWPVADIIRQHHERLDGSGYPQRLKGDAITLEARILAVADVVEAMSSHRPYRAGLGIESALTEIQDKRDRYFDPQAVDACIRLIREKNFTFENA